jgi:hypothetical protein
VTLAARLFLLFGLPRTRIVTVARLHCLCAFALQQDIWMNNGPN